MSLEDQRNQVLFLDRCIGWMTGLVAALVIFGLVSVLSGCTGTGSPTIPVAVQPTVYKYDLTGSVGGEAFDGVGVVDLGATLDVQIQSSDSVDVFTVSSCHRDETFYAAITQGWITQNKAYDYSYSPAPGIENIGSCLLRLGSYTKTVGGQNGWALIDFRTPEAILPAVNTCNGASGQAQGVSMCQSRAGLLEQISFDSQVTIDTAKLKTGCNTGKFINATTWQYTVGLGECVYAFDEVAKPHRKHRHTTVGYNQILIRTGQ